MYSKIYVMKIAKDHWEAHTPDNTVSASGRSSSDAWFNLCAVLEQAQKWEGVYNYPYQGGKDTNVYYENRKGA